MFSEPPIHVSDCFFFPGAAFSGAGKTPAYRHGLEQPLQVVEEHATQKLMMPSFTGSAFLRIQSDNGGQGIVCHDEMYATFMNILRRSSAGSDSSGERQCVLSAWNGGRISMTYATKDNIDVATSALTIGGFTQPDRLVEILQEVMASSDGLLERMLFWCLPGPARRVNKAKRAKEQLTEEYKDLCNLGQLMTLIYDLAHLEGGLRLSFTEEAQSLLSRVYDGAQKGMEADAVIEPDSEGSDDEEDELMEPIVTPSGAKLADHIAKVSKFKIAKKGFP